MSGTRDHKCPTCTVLKRRLSIASNDLGDVKQKLVRFADRSDEARLAAYVAQADDAKIRLEDAELELAAHQAAEHTQTNPAAIEFLEPDPVAPTEPPAPDALPLLGWDTRPWVDDALCAQVDPELFFPEKGGSTKEAKYICSRCTVAAECLDYALEQEERFGIWGGVSERTRRKIKHPTPSTTTNLDQESA